MVLVSFSPTEIVTALEGIANITQIFPASTSGPRHAESLASPMLQAL